MTGIRFRTKLEGAATGSATGIVVPPKVVAALDHGQRPPVKVTLNGHTYRSTIAVMGGRSMIGVSALIRKATGLSAGDPVEVELELDTSPREVDIPPDFATALNRNPRAKKFFATLSNSLQRYHVDNISGAKTYDTRQCRIDKSIALFLDNKPR
jgi:hypothetical protein